MNVNEVKEGRQDFYDLVVIGSGPAGESAADLATAFGHRSLIIEKDKPGGTVTTTGGAPTKTLREAALYFTGFRDRDIYGLHMTATPQLALHAIRKRTWEVCESLQRATFENISRRGIDYLQGTARLISQRTVLVNLPDGSERKIAAKAILIATGSRPVRPAGLALDHPGVCDTDSFLKRGRPPKSLLIVGGGAVGVEFATIACAMSIPVTLVNRSECLLSMMDGEVTERLGRLFSKSGIEVLGNCTVEKLSARADWVEATLSNGQTKAFDTVLFAAGRVANIQGLGLETAGVKVDKKGRIVVDSGFRTTADGIYAAGDVLRPTLASVAMEQGRIMVCNAFEIPFEGTIDPTPVSAVYGIPEIAGAGLTEQVCRKKGLDYEIGCSELDATPRGAIAGRGGLLKLIFLKEDRKLVGAHSICDIASELIGIGQMAIRCGATVNTIMNMSMNTPTFSYAYKYAAFDGLRRLTGRCEIRRSYEPGAYLQSISQSKKVPGGTPAGDHL